MNKTSTCKQIEYLQKPKKGNIETRKGQQATDILARKQSASKFMQQKSFQMSDLFYCTQFPLFISITFYCF